MCTKHHVVRIDIGSLDLYLDIYLNLIPKINGEN